MTESVEKVALPVTQADRDAASDAMFVVRGYRVGLPHDEHWLIQMFAAHRQAALSAIPADLTAAHARIAEGTPSARITGDKDRENPVEGAPYGEGLIGRIDQLEAVNRRLAITAHSLRSVLRTIAEMGYVDHQSGNQNFEALQSVARGGLESTR